MKKGNRLFLSIVTISVISAPLFATNTATAEIFDDENISKKAKDEKIRNLQNQTNLNHLFENSKFPVDDYIYKAGKREPNEDQNLTEILNRLEKLGNKQQNAVNAQRN